MLHARSFDPHAHRVVARYPDGWYAFALSVGTTFGELAGKLEDLEGMHEGAVIDVKVSFGKKSTQQTRCLLRSADLDRVTHRSSKIGLH